MNHNIARLVAENKYYPSELPNERIADGVIHFISLGAVLVAGVSLIAKTAIVSSIGLVIACAIYCTGLFSSFIFSAFYHLFPRHDWRLFLRRLDHLAIYALIAGTFTPLLVHVGTSWAYFVLAAIWSLALPAMAFKLISNNIEPKWSLASYLGLGWMGLLAVPEFGNHLSTAATVSILIGGLTYTSGTYFYAKKEQAYRQAIWHVFVLTGTGFMYYAIWTTVFSNGSIQA